MSALVQPRALANMPLQQGEFQAPWHGWDLKSDRNLLRSDGQIRKLMSPCNAETTGKGPTSPKATSVCRGRLRRPDPVKNKRSREE